MYTVIFLAGCSATERATFSVPANYRTWQKATKRILDYEVPGHGATIRLIYGNDIAFSAAVTKDKNGADRIIMLDGSIIIKEIFNKRKDVGKTEPSLVIMVKDTRSRLAQDGWVYYKKSPGQPLQTVEGRMCIGCHEAANEPHPYFDKNTTGIFRDYLFTKYAK
jgi:hypothetical protein